MPILAVRHLTRYRYAQPVRFGEHRMMFRPREAFDQRVLGAVLRITPEPSELHHVQDVFGNCVGIARFDGWADQLCFESEVVLEHAPQPLRPIADEPCAGRASLPFAYSPEEVPDLAGSVERRHADPDGELGRWAMVFAPRRGETSLVEILAAMTRSIHQNFSYGHRHETGVQTPLQTLQSRRGTCRDFALLMIEAARSLGLAARFVSGYIHVPASASNHRGGGHTHAWVRVYLPLRGWVEFDPTNGIVGSSDLIRVAIARDPRQATPLHGSFFGPPGAYLGMDVEVDVDVRGDAEPEAAMGVAVAAAG